MANLKEKNNIIDSLEIPKESIFNKNVLNINSIKLSKIKKLKNNCFDSFTVTFSNNFNENCNLIKKLTLASDMHILFPNLNSNTYNLEKCNDNTKNYIQKALKAISITNYRERITYLYDEIFSYLDDIWKKNNPCKFCNNKCIASVKGRTSHKENGCCYSFNYSKNPLKLIENVKVCEYLGEDKSCMTQNLSCKLFVCRYLRKNNLFDINLNNIFLIQAFFSKHKQLVLKENYFVSKEELINKTLENDDYIPYLVYYLNNYYRIRK